jgi:hypothetical protein
MIRNDQEDPLGLLESNYEANYHQKTRNGKMEQSFLDFKVIHYITLHCIKIILTVYF